MDTLKLDDNNVNFSFNAFGSKMAQLVGQHLPTRKLTKKQIRTKQKPWITSAIKSV